MLTMSLNKSLPFVTDETCSYCSKKGHTDAVCFAKRDDDKMAKMAEQVFLSVRKQISAENHELNETAKDKGNNQFHSNSRNWLAEDIYPMMHSKPKSDVVLLKLNSGDAWFADASVNGTPFKFLMDTGASKSVMSMKYFKSVPVLFQPELFNTRMKFQVANSEVLASMGVAHITICMYGYTFNLPIYVCDMADLDCIFGLVARTEAGFITCQRTLV